VLLYLLDDLRAELELPVLPVKGQAGLHT
jgi:hypothetical protein